MEPSPDIDYTETYRRHRAMHRRRWLVLFGLFLVINGGAFLGPKYYYRKDQARLEKLETILSAQSNYLQREQTRLDGMQQEMTREKKSLAPLATTIESAEKKNPKGIPGPDYPAYLKRVKDYNKRASALNALAARYDRAVSIYRGDAALYARYSAEADTVTQKLRTAWSVLPFHLPSPAPPPPPPPAPASPK